MKTRTTRRTLVATLLLASALTLPGATRPAAAVGEGYWLLGGDGGVFTFGDAPFLGSTGDLRLNQPVVGMAAHSLSAGAGYWLVAADGGVFTFGDAPFHGSTGDLRLNKPVVAMAEAPTGGYWLVASDGGVFSFGDARFSGSTGDIRLNQPVVGMAATPTGAGYWMASADGGVFAFGDAPFFGSAAGLRPPRPVVGIAAHPDGAGYWVVAADGTLYAFGSARALGTVESAASPIVGISSSPSGSGYWLVAADGAVFAFGDAPLRGSAAGRRLNRPMVGMAAPRSGIRAESKQPGVYTEASDGFLAATFQGGTITKATVAIADCFCYERVDFGIAVEGAGGAQRLVTRVTNLSGVPIRLPDGLRIEVVGTGKAGSWSLVIREPAVRSLDRGAAVTLSVPVPVQPDGDYTVSGRTVVVLD